jgi:hypothetical protein
VADELIFQTTPYGVGR